MDDTGSVLEMEHHLCSCYEQELARLAALDRQYYLGRPSRAEKFEYWERQAHADEMRAQFYSELAAVRTAKAAQSGTFRVVIKDRINRHIVESAELCSIAHDMNNQLNVLLGRSQLLAESLQSQNRDVPEHLAVIVETAKRMARQFHTRMCPRYEPSHG